MGNGDWGTKNNGVHDGDEECIAYLHLTCIARVSEHLNNFSFSFDLIGPLSQFSSIFSFPFLTKVGREKLPPFK